MTVTTKIISATVALGAVGGIGYTATHFLSGETLGKVLEDKGHKLLSFNTEKNDDKATWDSIIKDYAGTTNKLNNLTITLPDSKAVTVEQVNQLKQECQKVISSKSYSDSNLSAAEQFCVTPINIKALFEKQKYTVLDTNDNDEKNQTEWDQKVQNYLSKGSQNPLSGITLTATAPTPTDPKARRNELRKGCKALESINTHASTFHSNYSKFKEWCAIEK